METNKTCEPTNSGVEDIRASEQYALLSFVDTLASDSRPSPDGVPSSEGTKREKLKDRLRLRWLPTLPSYGSLLCRV